MSRSVISAGTKVLATGAFLLGGFLAVGFVLPHTWSAEASAVIGVPPEDVLPFLDDPQAWRRWSAWPDSGISAEGPVRGAGARLSWNDPELGEGTFEIVEVVPPTRVRYSVAVDGGRMRTEGSFDLQVAEGGTLVRWREEGDFGRNPLMGYWTLFMAKAQGQELEKALARLDELVKTETAPAGGEPPTDAAR